MSDQTPNTLHHPWARRVAKWLTGADEPAPSPARRDQPRPGVEALEGRSLMAAGVFQLAAQGAVAIVGTAGADAARAQVVGDQVEVVVADQLGFAQAYRFRAAEVRGIYFFGNQGNDSFVNATGIASYADGGDGNDLLVGGAAGDILLGGNGDDALLAGGGNDRLDGGFGNDVLSGDTGNDTIDGGLGHDILLGQAGDDRLAGGDGVDILVGGAGIDSQDGGSGDDFIFFDISDYYLGTLNGGTGFTAYRYNGTEAQFDQDVAYQNVFKVEQPLLAPFNPTQVGGLTSLGQNQSLLDALGFGAGNNDFVNLAENIHRNTRANFFLGLGG